jgi:hypothetical protein
MAGLTGCKGKGLAVEQIFLKKLRRSSGRREEATRQQGSLFLGRTVPTEAKPSELSGEILSLAVWRVKA